MSVLRKSLKRPETYLALLAILLLVLVLDTLRSPSSQLTGQLYVGGVRLYQVFGRPLLRGHIRCRYRPTCSEYSIEAVRQHGIRHGLMLTVRRIESCTTDVRPGTFDPVPAPKGAALPLMPEAPLRHDVASKVPFQDRTRIRLKVIDQSGTSGRGEPTSCCANPATLH